jgi:acyl-CoA thioester hydrolase
MFTYSRLIQFYETDMMGIVHHGNYLRLFEEARVAWAHAQGILDYQKPESAFNLAVYETRVRHLKPAKFGDTVKIQTQAKIVRVKIIFEYRMWRGEELLAECRTEHVPLDLNLRLIKPPDNMKEVVEKQTWTETWLSSL